MGKAAGPGVVSDMIKAAGGFCTILFKKSVFKVIRERTLVPV